MQTIPGFIVYQRTGGLTAADKAKIAADVVAFAQRQGRGGRPGRPRRSSPRTARRPRCRVPLDRRRRRQGASTARRWSTPRRGSSKLARRPRRPAWSVHSAGAGRPAGRPSSTPSAASTARCCSSAGVVVIVILLIVYRSPVLWFFPLFSAVLALGSAALVDLPAREARRHHAERAEPGHPVGARDRCGHRLRAAADQPLPRGAARVRAAGSTRWSRPGGAPRRRSSPRRRP